MGLCFALLQLQLQIASFYYNDFRAVQPNPCPSEVPADSGVLYIGAGVLVSDLPLATRSLGTWVTLDRSVPRCPHNGCVTVPVVVISTIHPSKATQTPML
ncbi:hypothetical protein ASPBRDRAFT_41630 [Aspergillus brasiliensis CBS 101740]|uniref:Uncharacterized protein n=1 Tax=Aspergillus brasiliensis (strain CBS 101740 / IMI 381727 / IBT 21946) TaxID=767769 RepID=A0A1L9UQJ7_ASPBC|nr:hypothetical protein ASPBRDRAFT_41630 [Aspergillus brasiliensis CBS 101740]